MHNATAKPDNRYLQQETMDATANLAATTASDRAAITQLTATAARLTLELATVNENLVLALQANRASQGRLWRARQNQPKMRIQNRSRTGTGAGSPAIIGTGALNMADEKNLEPPIHYCWMYDTGCRHNSSKCPDPATVQIYTSTKRNM